MNKILLVISFLLATSCQEMDNKQKDMKEVEEIRLGRSLKPSEIIRNPLGEAGLDTSRVAKLTFEEISINFGSVKEGEMVEKSFIFTNTSNYPLYIVESFSTCGCTVPEWPKGMIEPGGGGLLKVKFNTEGKINWQKKAITIIANTFPSETLVYLEGNVNSKN
jgi:hypothetical protein